MQHARTDAIDTRETALKLQLDESYWKMWGSLIWLLNQHYSIYKNFISSIY